jgi:hypothetical protein
MANGAVVSDDVERPVEAVPEPADRSV